MIHTPTAAGRRLAANDAYTFLMKELEKVDEAILEPLTATEWPRDMPVITGGGLLESVASIDVTYASTGGEDDNLFFDMWFAKAFRSSAYTALTGKPYFIAF